MRLRYLSLFSGIEACSVAWKQLGWECVGVAEIEPFPCAVLAHHYPDVPNLGSVTDITDEQIAALGQIDLVVGGSPCQDLSVAGKRKGLAGERSGLFDQQVRIFHAARRLCGARWLLWENVPGAFSSNKGRDFAEVVGAMAGCGFDVPRNGWQTAGIALGPSGLVEWSVLDAQWFGVAQRRRRVFAVLDTGDWAGRPPLFSEQQSLSGDSPPSRDAGEVAPTIPARSTGGGGLGTDFDCDGGLIPSHDPACTLTARDYKGALPKADLSTVVSFHANMSVPDHQTDGSTPTLKCAGVAAVAFAENQRGEFTTSDIANALTSGGGKPGQGYAAAMQGMSVRRLTPREAERLQGFHDDYTAIPYRNKPADQCPDGPRYKALGNSMAVPVMRYIAERIADAVRYQTETECINVIAGMQVGREVRSA